MLPNVVSSVIDTVAKRLELLLRACNARLVLTKLETDWAEKKLMC